MKNIKLFFSLSTIFLININIYSQLKVKPSGDVGIGTLAPTHALEVVGNDAVFNLNSIILNSNTSDLQIVGSGAVFKINSNIPTSCAFIRGNRNYSTGTDPDYTFYNDDRTGISHPLQSIIEFNSAGWPIAGVYPPGTADVFDVYSNAIAWQWNLHSDKRLKKNILKLDSTLNKLMRINSYSYEFDKSQITKNIATPGRHIGFIAQEVQPLFPELVSNDNEGFLSMDYNGMIPILLEAIKELKAEVDYLKTQIKK